jgi:hypothetical protein
VAAKLAILGERRQQISGLECLLGVQTGTFVICCAGATSWLSDTDLARGRARADQRVAPRACYDPARLLAEGSSRRKGQPGCTAARAVTVWRARAVCERAFTAAARPSWWACRQEGCPLRWYPPSPPSSCLLRAQQPVAPLWQCTSKHDSCVCGMCVWIS